MARFYVVYGTGEGQTAKVADRLAETIRDRGHEVTVSDVTTVDSTADLNSVDAVLVGSSIHLGKHTDEIRDFVESHLSELEAIPSAFFQVSLSSAVDDEERRAEAAAYVDRFTEDTGWHPDRIGLFGGALRYSKYGFLKRLLIKRIAKDATGDTDASRDYEYTDWNEVEQFGNDVAAFVEGRLGIVPPDTEE